MSDPRISDKELAQINAAAVTQEYRVKPHLGRCRALQNCIWVLTRRSLTCYQIIVQYLLSTGE